MSTSDPISGSEPRDATESVAPVNEDYARMMAIFEKRAKESHDRKGQAIAELSTSATDEELLDQFGLDMRVLRDEVDQEQES